MALITLQDPQYDRISGKRQAQSFTIPVAALFACHEAVNSPTQRAPIVTVNEKSSQTMVPACP